MSNHQQIMILPAQWTLRRSQAGLWSIIETAKLSRPNIAKAKWRGSYKSARAALEVALRLARMGLAP